MNEEQRTVAVSEQMKSLLDAATTDTNPISNLLRALLYAEMYERNERTRQMVLQARLSLIETLHIGISRRRHSELQNSMD